MDPSRPALDTAKRRLYLGFVRINKPACPKSHRDLGQAGFRDRKAALTSSEHAGVADHLLIHVPGTVDHDGSRQRIAIRRIEPLEPHRTTMSTLVERARSIGAGGSRVRARLIGKAFEPSCVRRVGAPAMRHQMRLDGAVGGIYQVEPRCARGKGEVYDADHVLINDAEPVSIQSIECAPQQAGIYLPVGSHRPPERELGACGHRSNPGKGKIDEKTARKYQDAGLQQQ